LKCSGCSSSGDLRYQAKFDNSDNFWRFCGPCDAIFFVHLSVTNNVPHGVNNLAVVPLRESVFEGTPVFEPLPSFDSCGGALSYCNIAKVPSIFFNLFKKYSITKSTGLRRRIFNLLKEKGTEQTGTRAERPKAPMSSVGKRRKLV